MKEFVIKRTSWHYRFIVFMRSKSVYTQLLYGTHDLCTYLRLFIGSVLMAVFMSLFILMLLLVVSLLGIAINCPSCDDLSIINKYFLIDLNGYGIWVFILVHLGIGLLSMASVIGVIVLFAYLAYMANELCRYLWAEWKNRNRDAEDDTPKEQGFISAAYETYSKKLCRKVRIVD